ncbi:signal recognition particle protein [Acetobacteraceae bacterium]|nr:signal recognition particle protein [Acetobacteraceae bacterium]
MFDRLSQRMSGVFEGVSRGGKLSEADVKQAMREARLAMLEADVALPVVRDFVAKVRERAVGEEVAEGVSAGQTVAKIINDTLVEILGGADAHALNIGSPPSIILMAGLQGAGKTTTAGKIAHRLAQKENKRTLLASLDVYRPAAQLQLTRLAEQAALKNGGKVEALPIVEGEKPAQIAKRALDKAKREGFDILILDTAGRLSIDEALMAEIKEISEISSPQETLLVVDAMTGQDAANTAKAFHEAIHLTGVVLSRMDGDARGGAALSMKEVSGAPIKFLGMGEKLEALEVFHADRMAGRILGLGDVAGLVETVEERLDQEEGERVAKRMAAGEFDLEDYLSQIKQISRLGSISGILGMLPGMGKIKDLIGDKGMDTSFLKKHEVIISSMTRQERKNPDIIKASRKKRIAKGAGVDVAAVNRLLKQFAEMSKMMKRVRKMGMAGLFGGGGRDMAAMGKMLAGKGGEGLPQMPHFPQK